MVYVQRVLHCMAWGGAVRGVVSPREGRLVVGDSRPLSFGVLIKTCAYAYAIPSCYGLVGADPYLPTGHTPLTGTLALRACARGAVDADRGSVHRYVHQSSSLIARPRVRIESWKLV